MRIFRRRLMAGSVSQGAQSIVPRVFLHILGHYETFIDSLGGEVMKDAGPKQLKSDGKRKEDGGCEGRLELVFSRFNPQIARA